MLEQGTVVSASDGRADIMITPTDECDDCEICTEGAGGRRILEGAVDPIGVAPGDVVELETPLRARRAAQLLIFVFPVVALVLGYLAGYLLSAVLETDPDTLGAAGAITAAVLALLALRGVRVRASDGTDETPRVHAIIARGQEPPGSGSARLQNPRTRRTTRE
jgi:sigma-E factor negative regulatory protein RseC